MFTYFEKERERESKQGTGVGGGGRGAGRQRIPSRPRTIGAEPDAGLEPTNCEIMT